MPPPGRKLTSTLPSPQKNTPRKASASSGKFLSQATTHIEPRASFFILLSAPGMGKSSLAAEFPSPVFMCDSMERGIEALKERSLVPDDVAVLPPIDTWDDALSCLRELATHDHPYKTLVIEGVAGYQKLCFDYVCNKDYQGNFSGQGDGFYSYYSGPKVAGKRYFPEFSNRIEAIRDRGIIVIMTGHTSVKTKANPGGSDYMAEIVDCEVEVWNSMHRSSDAILVMADDVSVNTKALKPKLKSTGHTRMLQCVAGGAYGGKNRWNLQDPIPTGESANETYQNLCQAALLDPATAFYTP